MLWDQHFGHHRQVVAYIYIYVTLQQDCSNQDNAGIVAIIGRPVATCTRATTDRFPSKHTVVGCLSIISLSLRGEWVSYTCRREKRQTIKYT